MTTKKSKYYYDIDRNLDSSRGINIVFCKTCKTCPAINIHKDVDNVVLGGEDEGFSIWTKDQFKEMVEEIKKGKFDEYI
ncbi:MAG: hypothetical protein CMH62_00545 [Nanoarchaeota archaeon]|jgi:hypothetical protein|nr:hypothetical protein [Nanoarchaeota archaeon]|tara:strand:- start:2093 stop:2329 length:237 start_codon:yes stop_codon:yes gene_type:complete